MGPDGGDGHDGDEIVDALRPAGAPADWVPAEADYRAALESHVRQLAVELASHGVTVNAMRGGVTRTPAAERIPESDALFVEAVHRNPHKRLTTPEDVANAIVAMSKPGTDWITGNVIRVDGGEGIAG